MAPKKLTLSVDEKAIEKARRYSKAHGVSISRLVDGFLSGLPESKQDLSPEIRSLIGVIPSDVDRDQHRRHLETKYDS